MNSRPHTMKNPLLKLLHENGLLDEFRVLCKPAFLNSEARQWVFEKTGDRFSNDQMQLSRKILGRPGQKGGARKPPGAPQGYSPCYVNRASRW